MKKKFLNVALFLATGLAVNAQVGIGTTTPDASAALDITSSTTGLLIPRMTTAQRTAIASPVAGLQVYDTTTNTTWYYNGTAWANSLIASDLRLVGTNNHVTSDAGVSGNGTSLGSGNANTAINAAALSSNTTGVSNIAIGASALSSNTAGSQNIAQGYQALYSNSVGNNNVGLGFGSLFSSTGSNNVGVGISAGNNVTTGSNNIALGYSTNMATPTASNQLNIGNVIFGTELTGSVSTPAGNIGIGTAAPNASAALDVTSTTKGFLKPRMTSAQRAAIASPANGLEVYDITTNSIWYYNGTAWTDAKLDLKNLGSSNHVTSDAGFGSTGTSLGTGNANLGMLTGSLANITTGSGNVAIGQSSLLGNTAGGYNVALGYNTMYQNTTGGFNIGLGFQALGANTTSSNNIGIGTGAGDNITTGGNSIAIGTNTQFSSPTNSYQMNIGNAIFGTNLFGNVNTPAGNIGIGTASPNADAALHVSSPSANKGLLLPVVALTGTANVTPLTAHVAGMVVYNTATVSDVVPGVYVNDGTAWTKL